MFWDNATLRKSARFTYADGHTGQLVHTSIGWSIITPTRTDIALDPLSVCLYLNYLHAEPAAKAPKQGRLL